MELAIFRYVPMEVMALETRIACLDGGEVGDPAANPERLELARHAISSGSGRCHPDHLFYRRILKMAI